MAWGDKTASIELVKAQVELEFLRKENEKLNKQVETLQDALVSASAPKAWDQMQREKAYPETKEELAQRMKALQEAAWAEKYLEEIEKPLFGSPEEMIEMLSSGIPRTMPGDQPIDPENSES